MVIILWPVSCYLECLRCEEPSPYLNFVFVFTPFGWSLFSSVKAFVASYISNWNEQFSGVFLLMILIPSVATERASAKFVFTHFNTDNGDGISSRPYIFVLGLLMSQYTLTGYDASAHMVNLYLFLIFLFIEFFFLQELSKVTLSGTIYCISLELFSR